MSAAAAVKEALWLRKVLPDLGVTVGAVSINCDNQAAISLMQNPIASARSKHIDVMHHFARERVARGEIEFKYISTDTMLADCMTKPLPVIKFVGFREGMGVKSRLRGSVEM